MTTDSFLELQQGQTVSWQHAITAEEVDAFARLSGDVNPIHLDDTFARVQGFRGRVVHGALLTAFISRVLGTQLPGPGCLWLSQTTRFLQPVYIDDTIDVTVRVVHKSDALHTLMLETSAKNRRGETVFT